MDVCVLDMMMLMRMMKGGDEYNWCECVLGNVCGAVADDVVMM